MRILLATLHKH